jgi:ATP-dependent Clp protease ATP-binding subunit ClpC
VFQEFTDDARRVVYAQEESRLLGHPHIGTEHLLLGLLHNDPLGRDTVQILTEAGVHPDAVRQHLNHPPADAAGELAGHIPFSPHAQRNLEQAAAVGARLGQGRLTRAHLLVALLTVAADARGVQILQALGSDLAHLISAAERVAARSEPEEPTDRPATAAATLRATIVTAADGPTASVSDRSPHLHQLMHERRRFAAALRRYGRHDNECDPDGACTCGLGPILDDAGLD